MTYHFGLAPLIIRSRHMRRGRRALTSFAQEGPIFTKFDM